MSENATVAVGRGSPAPTFRERSTFGQGALQNRRWLSRPCPKTLQSRKNGGSPVPRRVVWPLRGVWRSGLRGAPVVRRTRRPAHDARACACVPCAFVPRMTRARVRAVRGFGTPVPSGLRVVCTSGTIRCVMPCHYSEDLCASTHFSPSTTRLAPANSNAASTSTRAWGWTAWYGIRATIRPPTWATSTCASSPGPSCTRASVASPSGSTTRTSGRWGPSTGPSSKRCRTRSCVGSSARPPWRPSSNAG